MSQIFDLFKDDKTPKTTRMNLNKFTTKYGYTLHTDPKTDKTYLKIPIADLSDLGFMQESLLKAIQMLIQVDTQHRVEFDNSLYWLARILSASYPRTELDGLAELYGQQEY